MTVESEIHVWASIQILSGSCNVTDYRDCFFSSSKWSYTFRFSAVILSSCSITDLEKPLLIVEASSPACLHAHLIFTGLKFHNTFYTLQFIFKSSVLALQFGNGGVICSIYIRFLLWLVILGPMLWCFVFKKQRLSNISDGKGFYPCFRLWEYASNTIEPALPARSALYTVVGTLNASIWSQVLVGCQETANVNWGDGGAAKYRVVKTELCSTLCLQIDHVSC